MTILSDMVGHSRRHLGTAQRDINKETPTMTGTTAKEGWGR
jgi:hypothetical protein